jgi:curved DNA-binding protein
VEFKDYYKALGLERGADQKAVSRAFRRLAREFHPDVNKRRGAEDRFKEINEAYQVLGDPAKRAQYDQIYEAYKNGGIPLHDLLGRGAGRQPGWTGPGGFTVTVGSEGDVEELFGRAGGFSEFFQQLFGGLGGFGPQGAGPKAPARLESTIELALEDSLHGGTRRVDLPAPGRRLEVDIPPGVRDGQTIRLAGAAAGRDVYLTVRIAPHRLFERKNDDLVVEVPVSIPEAALGAQVEVPTLDGKVTMTVPPETQTGRLFRLKGLGMPHAASRGAARPGRGDLYVRVKVVVPTGLSARERELFEGLRKARTDDPRRELFS